MDFLLTNDDGIQAEGLAALEQAALKLGGRVFVVAPAAEQSMCGHRVTTRSALAVEEVGSRRWTVAGTPADCVRVAIFALGIQPHWVLSGINHGGNMGQDIYISGTVAAVREAAYHGVRAAALSHYMIQGIPFDWPRMIQWSLDAVNHVLSAEHADGCFWNINFPHLPPGASPAPQLVRTAPCRSPLNVGYVPDDDGYVYTASYAKRPQDPGSDVEACFDGKISITSLRI
jgi:5'-nucleotidase